MNALPGSFEELQKAFPNASLMLPGADLTDFLWRIAHQYFRKDIVEGTAAAWTTAPQWHVPGTADDDTLVNKARRSKSDDNDLTFDDLWTANADKLGKKWPPNPDSKSGLPYEASSSDQSLITRLMWWAGGDCARVERLMQREDCGLRRPKWDERPDYRRDTILNALALIAQNPPKDKPVTVPKFGGTLPAGATLTRTPFVADDKMADAEPIPQARHVATDQRNVDRIIAAYGKRLLSVGGKLYAWSGRHWEPDTGLARRFAGNLSRIVAEEREQAEARYKEEEKLEGNGKKLGMLKAVIDSLEKWGPKCEMAATQNAALKMLVEAVKIDAEKLDANPLLINLENGTYNIDTGELQPHNPGDYITKVAPVKFDATAACPRFDRFLAEIFDENGELIGFVLRWFGYCATGEPREQFVVIHWGQGANGKGTLIWKCIAPILGDYAGAGAPGLLTAKNEDQRHPAEIADLFGKRMVTCAESDEGATLREGFVKQASGEDKMKGRFLHGQFFEFRPTHKLQLMTNKKPVVKGTDHGTWRRLLMLPYLNIFGSPEEIAAGKANKPRDNDLDAVLKAEWPGILNRLLQGARDWRRAGLKPPPAVLDASEAYRQEQDRIGEFVREELTLDINARTESSKLHAHYLTWDAGATGAKPLASKAFLAELEKHVPGFRRLKSHGVRWVYGVAIGQQPMAPPPPAKP